MLSQRCHLGGDSASLDTLPPAAHLMDFPPIEYSDPPQATMGLINKVVKTRRLRPIYIRKLPTPTQLDDAVRLLDAEAEADAAGTSWWEKEGDDGAAHDLPSSGRAPRAPLVVSLQRTPTKPIDIARGMAATCLGPQGSGSLSNSLKATASAFVPSGSGGANGAPSHLSHQINSAANSVDSALAGSAAFPPAPGSSRPTLSTAAPEFRPPSSAAAIKAAAAAAAALRPAASEFRPQSNTPTSSTAAVAAGSGSSGLRVLAPEFQPAEAAPGTWEEQGGEEEEEESVAPEEHPLASMYYTGQLVGVHAHVSGSWCQLLHSAALPCLYLCSSSQAALRRCVVCSRDARLVLSAFSAQLH